MTSPGLIWRLRVAGDMNGGTGWEVLELYNDVVRQRGREADVLVMNKDRGSAQRLGLLYRPDDADAAPPSWRYRAARLTPFLAKDPRRILGVGNACARDPPQIFAVRHIWCFSNGVGCGEFEK